MEGRLPMYLQGSPSMRGAYYLNNWGMVGEMSGEFESDTRKKRMNNLMSSSL